MRPFLLSCLTLLIAAPGAAAASSRLHVQRAPLYERGGVLLVHVLCDEDGEECDGRIGVGRARQRFGVLPGYGEYLRVPYRGGRSRIRLVLRQGGRTRTLKRRVRHRPDPVTCGYGKRARPLAMGPTARILVASLGGTDIEAQADAEVVLCKAGGASPMTDGSFPVRSGTITGEWAAVETYALNRTGGVDQSVFLRSLGAGGELHQVYLGDGTPIDRLLIAPDGAPLIGQAEPAGYTLRAVDGAGERVLDGGPGVDRLSVRLDGQTATWTHDGAPRSAVLMGRAR